MNIELEKIKLAQKIFTIDSEELITRIREFISTEEVDIWDALPDEIKASVERSLAQADKGELIPHEEAIKRVKRWH
jgi:predicted transcriptional regulator